MGGNRGRIEQFSRSINSLVGGEIKLKKKSSVNKSIHELEFDKEINELFTKTIEQISIKLNSTSY